MTPSDGAAYDWCVQPGAHFQAVSRRLYQILGSHRVEPKLGEAASLAGQSLRGALDKAHCIAIQ